MKNPLSILTLISLLTITTQAQATEQKAPSPSPKFLIAAVAPYNGRAPYAEVFEFICNTHLDLVDPVVRRQWSNRWQPDNVSPKVFHSRETTETAIKNMMQSLNRKHDMFMTTSNTAMQKAWFNATDTVRTRCLSNNIVLIKIPSFLPKTVDREAQLTMSKCAKAQAIIIDLRGNTGGLIKPALNVAATLIPQGLVYIAKARVDDQIVETKLSLDKTRWITVTSGTNPTVTEYSCRTQLAVAQSVPIVVLVDGQTASAAELLTGALKKSRRAVIIGTRTYGKGTGNKLTFLSSNGRSLQITHEKLFPGGLDTDGIGIQPDVVIDQPVGSPTDYQLETAIKALTKSIPQEAEQTPAPAKPETHKQPYGGSPYVRLY